ncbi:MAG: hypothetical protein ABI462_12510, partial [Ignavibacteria bacterium]
YSNEVYFVIKATHIILIQEKKPPGCIFINFKGVKMNRKNLLMMPILLLSFVFMNCNKDTATKEGATDKTKVVDTVKKTTQNIENKDAIVNRISEYRSAGEKKLVDNSFKKKTVTLKTSTADEDTKQKWEKLDAYYDGDKLVRLQTYPHSGISDRTEEFYIMDGKLVFAFIQDKGPKQEGKDTGEPGKEFYFDNSKLIKYVNTSGEKAKDETAEMKMYESKLPIEADELMEILKSAGK